MSITWTEKTKRRYLLNLIKKLAVSTPGIVHVPKELSGFGTVVYDVNKCIACGACTRMCEDKAIVCENSFDLNALKNLPKDSKATNRILLAKFIDKLKKKEIQKSVPVPEGLLGFGTIGLKISNCIACKECVRICEYDALSMKDEWNLNQILAELKTS